MYEYEMSYPFDFAPKFSTSHETNCGWAKWLFCFWLRVGFVGWQPKANVPLWVGIKFFFKMCGGENKKYRSVGIECRLTHCQLEIWSENGHLSKWFICVNSFMF